MRLGTWNLEQRSPRGQVGAQQRELMSGLAVELWFLTEVHHAVTLPGQTIWCSPQRPDRSGQHWSAISSTAGLQGLPSAHDGLALARVDTPHGPLLAACSVMPWRGARTCWPGDPAAALSHQFHETLHDHVQQIEEARQEGESLLWGGDFNQALTGPERVGSRAGRDQLRAAFAQLDLAVLTEDLPHVLAGLRSIDHVAVPDTWTATDWRAEPAGGRAGKRLSDHSCYVGVAGPAPRVIDGALRSTLVA